MHYLREISSLFSLVKASPKHRQVYKRYRDSILTSVVVNDLVARSKCSLIQFPNLYFSPLAYWQNGACFKRAASTHTVSQVGQLALGRQDPETSLHETVKHQTVQRRPASFPTVASLQGASGLGA